METEEKDKIVLTEFSYDVENNLKTMIVHVSWIFRPEKTASPEWRKLQYRLQGNHFDSSNFVLNSECWDRAGFLILFARAIRKQAYPKAACICECEMQVLSSQKQIT